jgi:DNA modification methylase
MNELLNKITQGDCLEVMRTLPNNSVDLVVIDPPYNIGKDKRWDKWSNVDEYVSFMIEVFRECGRVLKPTGSFYWFHNDMIQITKLIEAISKETSFVFKQFIVWNKRFDGARNKGFLDGFVEVGGLRNYQQMAEYCLFYTFQPDKNETQLESSRNGFVNLLNYARSVREFIKPKYSRQYMVDTIGDGSAQHFLEPDGPQWKLCTQKTYEKLISIHKINEMDSFRDYDSLINEYDNSRYTYNNRKSHHSVWNYEIAPKVGHVTPKPIELIENIIRHSSNEGDIVLDCFLGSGTTAVAAINTNRQFIGIERETEYVEIGNRRIAEVLVQRGD